MNTTIDVSNIIDELVSATKRHRDSHAEMWSCMSPEYKLREVSTVKLTLPRRLGKTSYIKSRATNKDLVIVHHDTMKREYIDCAAEVISAYQVRRICSIGLPTRMFEHVYVDEPQLVFGDRLSGELFSEDTMYSLFSGIYRSSVHADMIIMLGT